MADWRAVSEAIRPTLNTITDASKFYRWSSGIARVFSYIFRIISLVCFIAGSLAPFADDLIKDWFSLPASSDVLRYGYVLLIFAGFATLADRVFLPSANWRRYARAKIALKLVKDALDLDIKRYELTKTNNANISVDDLEEIFNRVKEARNEVGSIEKMEIDSWASDHIEAIKVYEDRVAAVTEQVRVDSAKQEAARAAARPGNVEVTIEHADRVNGEITMTVAGIDRHFDSAPSSAVFEDVQPGLCTVRLSWVSSDGKKSEPEKSLEVRPGQVNVINFDIP